MIGKMSGLGSALDGLQRASARVEKAAKDINSGFTAAQNAQAADSVQVDGRAAVVPAVEDAVRGAVLPPEGEVSQALVNILQAKSAYKANLASVRTAQDMDDALAEVVGRKPS